MVNFIKLIYTPECIQVITNTQTLHVVLSGHTPPLNRHTRPLFPTARFSTSTPLCVARSFADPVVCRTLVRRPRDVSHAQYHCTIPSVIDAGASLDINHSLTSGSSIHTSSVQLHILMHVVQLKLHSSNYNHINVMHSIAHNIIPVHIVI